MPALFGANANECQSQQLMQTAHSVYLALCGQCCGEVGNLVVQPCDLCLIVVLLQQLLLQVLEHDLQLKSQ